ncbi:MAG: aspartate--tRNA(Asn) ligase [Alkaliphilus sp.]|nr:MAG: aspartate--tRNA(Asn) ligase [Alkaliphilus sp.]
MKRNYVKEVMELGETHEKLLLKGWVYKKNNIGKVCFLHLRDKTGVIQVVSERELCKDLRLETAISVYGRRSINKKAANGFEIQAEKIEIIARATYDKLPFVINKKEIEANLETQLNHRTIALRAPKQRAIFKVQGEIVESFRRFLREKQFTEINTPKIISSGTEGGSEMFVVNYYGKRAFLSQSPQFYKQMMVGAGFERVFEVGHAYRAELHNSWRHLSEYVSLDIEMGFIESEEDVMCLEEEWLTRLFSHIKKTCEAELELLGAEIEEVGKIPRITLARAQEILKSEFQKKSPEGDLDSEGEKLLAEHIKKKYTSDFVFITKYPAKKRPVYTMPDKNDKRLTNSFDLLYKGLEVTTGGQRIHEHELLKKNMIDFELDTNDFGFYLNTFKYGMVPHGGFAVGLERLTMQVLNLKNIREASLLPRDLKRITP